MGAVGRFGDAVRARMAKSLDELPALPAGGTSFAFYTLGVVPGVLVERHGVFNVGVADETAAAPAVVAAEEPGEGGIADGADVGGFVGFPMRGGRNAGDVAEVVV